MTSLTIKKRQYIENFISTNNSKDKFPTISPKKININMIFTKFVESNNDLEQYGSEGYLYCNCFYKHTNGKIYIITFNMDELDYYNNFNIEDLSKLHNGNASKAFICGF